MRVHRGETIISRRKSEENLENSGGRSNCEGHRAAIKKSRTGEIEAALGAGVCVRWLWALKSSSWTCSIVCRVMSDELSQFGESRYTGIIQAVIIQKKREVYDCLFKLPRPISEREFLTHGILKKSMWNLPWSTECWKPRDGYFEGKLTATRIWEIRTHRKKKRKIYLADPLDGWRLNEIFTFSIPRPWSFGIHALSGFFHPMFSPIFSVAIRYFPLPTPDFRDIRKSKKPVPGKLKSTLPGRRVRAETMPWHSSERCWKCILKNVWRNLLLWGCMKRTRFVSVS